MRNKAIAPKNGKPMTNFVSFLTSAVWDVSRDINLPALCRVGARDSSGDNKKYAICDVAINLNTDPVEVR